MKFLPGFVSNHIGKAVFLTLFAAFVGFLIIGPKLNKSEATHNYSCSIQTPNTTPGGNVSIQHSGLSGDGSSSANSEEFRMYGAPGGPFFAYDLGYTNNSTSSTRTQTFNIPSNAPAGNYRVEVDFRFHSPDKEDCNGSFNVAAASTPTPYNISAATVSGASAPFTVTVTWSPQAQGNVSLAIKDIDDPSQTVVWNSAAKGVAVSTKTTISMSTADWNVNPSIPLDGNFEAAFYDTLGGTLQSNKRTFVIPIAGGGNAPSCSVGVQSTQVGGSITVSGANMGNNALGIFVTQGTPAPATDIRIGDKGTADPFTVNLSLPGNVTAGRYTVYLDLQGFGTLTCSQNLDVVAIAGVTQPSCSSGAPPNLTRAGQAIHTYNCVEIQADQWEDKVFVANQGFALIDFGLISVAGFSQLHPEVNHITMGTGALAASGKLVAGLYSAPPASGVEYLAGQFQKLNPVQPAYAQQGIGYNALSPVQEIWAAFRNISYVGFIVVFVVVGFMIMFRAHISPQAVATVQDSLPRIVIALILVTFSYALAGLMIDIMFLFLNVLINALKAVGALDDGADVIFTQSVFGIVWGSWKELFVTVAEALNDVIDAVVNLGWLDGIIGFIGGGIGALVIAIALLFVMFRVFFMLLIAYATIVILTIAAPFFFLFQALPGNNGAKDWFKQMAANIAVFPVTAIMFLLAGILANVDKLGATGVGQLTDAEIGQFPLLTGGISAEAIGSIIGIGVLLMTPQAADMVKKAIGAQTPGGGNFGAVGAAVAGAGGVAMGIPRFAGNTVRESPVGRAVGDIREAGEKSATEKIITHVPGWMYGRKTKATPDEAGRIARGRLPPSK